MTLGMEFLQAFLITCGIEGVCVYYYTGKKQMIRYSLVCNAVTNPALNIFILMARPACSFVPYPVFIGLLEFLVVVVETFLYKKMTSLSRKDCFVLSLLSNTASFCVGLLISIVRSLIG